MGSIIKSTIEVRVLTAPEGMYLTQSAHEEGTERVFSRKVFLALQDSESQWRLTDEQEKQDYINSLETF